MTEVPNGYDFTLNLRGVEYAFVLPDPANLSRSDLVPFTAQGGSGLSLSQQTHFAAEEQRSFHGGVGQLNWIDKSRVWSTENVDTRISGRATLGPKLNSIDLASLGFSGQVLSLVHDPSIEPSANSLGGVIYFTDGARIASYDGTTLTRIDNAGGGAIESGDILALFHNGSYLFAGVQGRAIQRWNGTAWAPVNTQIHSACAFGKNGGYFWHAEAGSNLIHFWARESGEDAHAGVTDSDSPQYSDSGDPDAVQVGPFTSENIIKLQSFQGNLVVARREGLWEVRALERGGYQAYTLFQALSHSVEELNYRAMTIHNNVLWFAEGNNVYFYTGSSVTSLTPDPTIDAQPATEDVTYHDFISVGEFLYAIRSDGKLLASDGTWWHNPASGVLTGGGTSARFAYVPGSLLIFIYQPAGNPDHFLKHINMVDDKYFTEYAEVGRLHTSWFDGGYLVLDKFWSRAGIHAHIDQDDIDASLQIAAEWISRDYGYTGAVLGTLDSTDTTSDETSFSWNAQAHYFNFPTNGALATLPVGARMRFEFEFNNLGTYQQTPTLLGWFLEYVQRSETNWGTTLQLTLDDEMPLLNGNVDPHSMADKYAILLDARDSRLPLRYKDWLGHEEDLYISGLDIRVLERLTEAPSKPNSYAVAGTHPIPQYKGTLLASISLTSHVTS